MISFLWRKWVRRRLAKPRTILNLESVESRVVPAGLAAVGSQPGTVALVTVYDADAKTEKYTISPFPGFTGGVRVALGDVTGDGVPDVVAAAGAGGGPIVNVYDGTNGAFLKSFVSGDVNSRAGVSVAAADIDQDGLADIVSGTMSNGQPLLLVTKFSDLSTIKSLTPFTGAGSLSVAAGDVNGDGTPDLVAGSGPNVASAVAVFSGKDNTVLRSFNPFESTFLGGVYVAAGDVNGDAKADVIVSALTLGGPRVSVFSGLNGSVTANFFTYDSNLRDGTFAVAYNANGTGNLDLAATNGPNNPPDPKAFDSATTAQISASLLPGLPVTTAYDSVVPTVALSTTATNPTAGTPIPFTATFSEAVSGFTVSGLTVSNGTAGAVTRVDGKTFNFSVTPANDGTVTVTVNADAAWDAAGNKSTASTASNVTFDDTPPTVTANASTTNDQTPTLTGTVSESTATVSVSVGGQTIGATVTGTTWTAIVPTNLAEGDYTITATAKDTLGNPATATANLKIDITPPTPTVSSSAAPETATSPIPFTITFNEDVTGFVQSEVTVNGGTIASFVAESAQVYKITVTPAGEGDVKVSVAAARANDIAGNNNVASNELTVAFDTGDITVTANALTTSDSTPTLTGTVSDPTATVLVTVNGQQVTAQVTGTSWTAQFDTTIPDGTYDIEVSASDAQSNTGSLTVTDGLTVDTAAPTATVATAVTSPTNDSPIAFTVEFSEPVTGFDATKVSSSNGPVGDFAGSGKSYTFTVTPTAQGTVTVSLPAGAGQDAADNDSTVSNVVTLEFDSAAPTVAVDPLTTNDTTPELTGTVNDDDAEVSVTVNGKSYAAVVTTGTWSVTIPAGDALTAGTFDVAVTATDEAGNVGSAPGTGALVVDLTAPTVASITASPNTGTFDVGQTIDLTVTLSEAATLTGQLFLTLDTGAAVLLTQDGSDPAKYVGTYTVAAGQNSTDLDSTALTLDVGASLKDAAGNDADLTISAAATLAASASIVIDTTT